MPCTDGGVPYPNYAEESARKELRLVEATLCALMTTLESAAADVFQDVAFKSPLDLIDFKEAGVKRVDVENWWKHHKAIDGERRKREALERQEEVERHNAKLKLTKRERDLLGIAGPKRKRK